MSKVKKSENVERKTKESKARKQAKKLVKEIKGILDQLDLALAAELRKRGIKPSDRIASHTPVIRPCNLPMPRETEKLFNRLFELREMFYELEVFSLEDFEVSDDCYVSVSELGSLEEGDEEGRRFYATGVILCHPGTYDVRIDGDMSGLRVEVEAFELVFQTRRIGIQAAYSNHR